MKELARTLLERLSRRITFRRHLPPDLGRVPIVVSPGAALSFWKPRLESDLFDFAREFVCPGSVVWDVGGNVGLFTFAAAQRAGSAGHVLTMEADTWLVELLRHSATLQPATSAPVQVLSVAAERAVKIVQFNIANRGRASNFVATSQGASQTGGIRRTDHVMAVPLDWLLEQGIRPPDVLKIDVEGAESFVLQGAERVLREARPVVLCEVLEESQQIVTEILLRHGYKLFDWWSNPRRAIQRACFNTLAIPSAN